MDSAWASAAAFEVEQPFSQVVSVPNPWLTTDRLRVTLDNSNGRTYNPGTIDLFRLKGIRVARDGPNAADTFNRHDPHAGSSLVLKATMRLVLRHLLTRYPMR